MNQLSRKNILSHSINIFIWSEKNSRRKIWKKCFFLEKKFCMFWKTFACWRCSIELSIKRRITTLLNNNFYVLTWKNFWQKIDRWKKFEVALWRHLESCWLVPAWCSESISKKWCSSVKKDRERARELESEQTHCELIESLNLSHILPDLWRFESNFQILS